MKIFMTGATGFIGGNTAERLRSRGHELSCLVRDPARASALVETGAGIVEGDLSDRDALAAMMSDFDAVVHNAAVYEIGIPDSRRQALFDANVQGTSNVLNACLDAAIDRVLYVSSCVVFGNTHGAVADEGFKRRGSGFDSVYEQTKYEAHQIALDLIRTKDLPCVVVQPAGVFGPGDHSALGGMINQFLDGRLPLVPFPDLGSGETYVEDVAEGLVLALEQGREGECYILNSENVTVRQMLGMAAEITGHKPPGRAMPTPLLKLLRPVGPLIGKLMDQPPNLYELVRSGDGVTFYADAGKARRELGFEPRTVEQGLRDMLAAEGRI